MFSKIALPLLASVAIASPLTVVRRDGTVCGAMNPQGQCLTAQVGYYSDHDCNNAMQADCYYSDCSLNNAPAGSYECIPAILPSTTPYYARVDFTQFGDLQLDFTNDQSCPPSGPGAVFASLIDNNRCVEFNLGGSTPGVSAFPNGGAPIAKRNVTDTVKRANPKCKGFRQSSSEPTTTEIQQVSVIVDCTNGASSGCTISKGDQYSQSTTTMYSATAGGGIEGLFEVSATFGMSYTMSETTTIQESLTVQQGQRGYLAAYSAATLFHGTFTDCDSGPAEQDGTATVLKDNGYTYTVVNTGA